MAKRRIEWRYSWSRFSTSSHASERLRPMIGCSPYIWSTALVFQLRQRGIGPRQRRRVPVRDVDQAHTAARVHLARGTEAPGATIREGPWLFVTAAA